MNLCQSAGLAVLLAALTFNIEQSRADNWQQTMSAQFMTEFDTNPAMSPSYHGGVWRGIFMPGYILTGNFDADTLKSGLALQVVRSSDESLILNRESPSAFIDWTRQIVEGEYGVSGRYTEVDIRDAGIEATSLTLGASTRATRNISGKWRKAISQRSTLSADGSYEKVSYTGDTYIDYVARTGSMMFSYAWDEYNTPFFKLNYADYEPAGIGASGQLSSADAGWHWQSSDNLQGTLQAGKSINNDGETGTQGAVEVKYTGQRTEFVVNASRQVLPSGLGGFVTFDQANGSWSYAVSERSRTGINLEWRTIHYATDIINRTAGVWWQHNLNAYWDTRLYYLHRTREREGVGPATADLLGLMFTYTHNDF